MSPLFAALRDRAEGLGFSLVGAVDAAAYDAAQPPERRAAHRSGDDTGTLVVLGTGGRAGWDALVAAHGAPRRPHPRYHPIDAWGEAAAAELLGWLRAQGVGGRCAGPADRARLNLAQLAEMAGLGTISPVIHLLLHPEFGPWLSLRAVLLLPGRPFGPLASGSLDFHPCTGCARPCVAACPVETYGSNGTPTFRRCAVHRHRGGCEGGCDVRRACPVGSEHRYGEDEERFRHAYSLGTLRRHYGLGWWGLVPKAWR